MDVIKIPMYLDYKKSAMLFLLYGSAVPKWPSKIIVYKNRLLFEQIPLRKQPFFYFLCRLLPQFHFVASLPYGQSANCFFLLSAALILFSFALLLWLVSLLYAPLFPSHFYCCIHIAPKFKYYTMKLPCTFHKN